MATEVTKPRYADPAFSYSPDTPVVPLDAKDAFEKLSDKEKMYSHYMSRASVFGGLIVLLQTSPESPQVSLGLESVWLEYPVLFSRGAGSLYILQSNPTDSDAYWD